VLEGEIISVSMNTEWEEFLQQVWAPFHDWVGEAYPTNVAVMWTCGGNPQFTEESIALWERRSLEYAEFVTASEDEYIARTAAICTAAHARLNEELQAAGMELESHPVRTG